MEYRGVAYYPEYWPEERWDEDIRLMVGAHINMVRVGEFAWSAMEPAEGEYTLDWLHRLVRKMGDAGINILMCTPTAAPPAWLTTQYPEANLVQESGVRAEHGNRRHYCPTNPVYRKYSCLISDVLSRELSSYPNVVCWQLDNEFGPEHGWCHCEHCQSQFRTWLRKRYGSLDELNKRWGTRFWSVEFTSWEQIRLGIAGSYPSILLDTKRFRSDCFIDLAMEQATVIRANHPEAMVVTNGMGPLFESIDYYDLFSSLDRACDDMYFDIATMDGNALAMDIFRGYKPNTPFWVTETGSGALTCDKSPKPEQVRAWAFSALAHGCEAYCFFRWRTCPSGQEQELQGILEYTGKPRRRYEAVRATYADLEQIWPMLESEPLPNAEVAMIYDHDVEQAYSSTRVGGYVQFHKRFIDIHKTLYDRNVPVDVVPPGRDLSGYKVVALPSVPIVSDDFAVRLREFVAAGGTILSLPQLACRDANNNYLAECPPVGINDLFGLRVEGGTYLRSAVGPDESMWVPIANCVDQTPSVEITLGSGSVTGKTESWMEDIEIEGGTVLGKYTDNDFEGCPFLIENRRGSGRTIYCGSYPDVELLTSIVEYALAESGVALGPDTPEWVESLRRGRYTFVINHTGEPVEVAVDANQAVMGTYSEGKAILPPYGVCILE